MASYNAIGPQGFVRSWRLNSVWLHRKAEMVRQPASNIDFRLRFIPGELRPCERAVVRCAKRMAPGISEPFPRRTLNLWLPARWYRSVPSSEVVGNDIEISVCAVM
jgi:hypothetical protein